MLVDDGQNTISYNLDEALIEFGAALLYKGLEAAVDILEPLDITPETEANWKTLAKLALSSRTYMWLRDAMLLWETCPVQTISES